MMTKKPFYMVVSKDFFYCIPKKDLLIAAADNVKVDDEVRFKYNSLTLQGTVRFISDTESTVMEEISKEKKRAKKKRERSFHEDRPRYSAMRQKKLEGPAPTMVKQEVEDTQVKDKKYEKRKAAKVKELKRAAAANVTEQSILQRAPSTVSGRSANTEYDIYECPTDLGLENNDCDSSSSLEATNSKGKAAMARNDVKSLKNVDSSDDQGDCTLGKVSAKLNTDLPTSDVVSDQTGGSLVKGKSSDAEHNAAGEDGGDSTDVINDDSEAETEISRKSLKRSRSSSLDKEGSDKKKKKKKRSRSQSSSSSSDSSSSSCSSSSSSSSSESSSSSSSHHSSDSSDDEEMKRKSRKGKKKSKKSKKRKSNKQSKKNKKKRKVKRNLDIFPGPNFRWKETDPDVERVHPDYPIFIRKADHEECLLEAKSPQTYIKSVVGKVFRTECLKGSTAQGFPNRNQGSRKLKKSRVLPRVDPDGRKAILKRAEVLEGERKSWRPRIGKTAMSHAFTQAVGHYK